MKKIVSLILTMCAVIITLFPVCAYADTSSEVLSYSDYAVFEKYDFASSDISFPVSDVVVDKTNLKQNESGEFYISLHNEDKVSLSINVAETARYLMKVTYMPDASVSNPPSAEVAVKIDGEYPFEESKKMRIDMSWQDSGEIRNDISGNEFSAEQIPVTEWSTATFIDSDGYIIDGITFNLESGLHTIDFEITAGDFYIKEILLCVPTETLSYGDYSKLHETTEFSGEEITVECENGAKKTARSIVSRSDNSSASVLPCDAYLTKVNYIGGSNWSSLGDSISWNINVNKTGYYKLTFHYRQNSVTDASVYRRLLIDGEVPFKEAANIAFEYGTSWKNLTLGGDEPMMIYLEKGSHTVSLQSTLGSVSEICNELKYVVYDISSLYRKLVMMVGDSPDANRDYDLFNKIPNFEKNLTNVKNTLTRLSEEYVEVTGKSGSTIVSLMTSMNAVIDRMLDYKYQAQKYKSSFYSAYASLSAGVYEMMEMPLDLDSFTFSSNDFDAERNAGVFKSIAYSLNRFIASFVVDYNSISEDTDSGKALTLWVNWGRDQAQVLNQMVKNDFTPKTDIAVSIKVTNASIVQAVLSGNGPDCYLHLSRTEPINLAMRGALYDLKQFDDYEKVLSRFMKGSENPYKYGDGVYALPDTQTFYMMFVRNDIFEELGLEIPKTWDDFILVSKVLMQNNMQVGLPYAQITSTTQINSGAAALTIFPSLLLQNGVNVYKKDLSGVDLYNTKAIETFEFWIDLYTKYGLPKTYDFYNRFRTGLMPLAIQAYTMYAQLSTAASEINGLWEMVEIPGVLNDDGTVNRVEAGGGTGCVILKQSKNHDTAWEFLKWWTDAETQADYSFEVESILGTVSRVATANVEAVSMMTWDSKSYKSLMNQWSNVRELNEVPGGYYVSRGIDQAFWSVVNSNENPKDMLYKWNTTINEEINRKYLQYTKKENNNG